MRSVVAKYRPRQPEDPQQQDSLADEYWDMLEDLEAKAQALSGAIENWESMYGAIGGDTFEEARAIVRTIEDQAKPSEPDY